MDATAWEGILNEVAFQLGLEGCAEFGQVATGIGLLWTGDIEGEEKVAAER